MRWLDFIRRKLMKSHKKDEDEKECLETLANRMAKAGKAVCDVNLCYYSAEYAIRYLRLSKSILKGYDIDAETMTEADFQRMSKDHKFMFVFCGKEGAIYSRLAESLYRSRISPFATLKPDTKDCILCTDCCTCTEFFECDNDALDLRKQVSELGGELRKMMEPVYHAVGSEIPSSLPFADMVEKKDDEAKRPK